tara:strand:+ start:418 stop:591 length:174 start_codon:yes stop_codon:yes gene_type:complete
MELELENYKMELSNLKQAYENGSIQFVLDSWKDLSETHEKIRLLVGITTNQRNYSTI